MAHLGNTYLQQAAVSAVSVADDATYSWGDGEDFQIVWDTGQTNASAALLVSGSNNVIIQEKSDLGTDWAYANSTNPTLWIRSADQTNANDYIAIYHNQSNAIYEAGSGSRHLFQVNGTECFNANASELVSRVVRPDGDGTRTLGTSGASWGVAYFAKQLYLKDATAPTGVANTAQIYAEDNGGGKTRLMVVFGDDVPQQLAIEP